MYLSLAKNFFMKKHILCTLTMIVGFTFPIIAQSGSTVNATTANASLLVAMSLSEIAPLNFGSSLLSNTSGGTVILPSNSTTRGYTGGVVNSAATPAPAVAAYSVSGTGLETYVLVLPAITTVSHTSVYSGVNTMNITAMTARFNGAVADSKTSTLTSEGKDSFTLGGTLNVQENQIGGQYSGTFQVSVDYN